MKRENLCGHGHGRTSRSRRRQLTDAPTLQSCAASRAGRQLTPRARASAHVIQAHAIQAGALQVALRDGAPHGLREKSEAGAASHPSAQRCARRLSHVARLRCAGQIVARDVTFADQREACMLLRGGRRGRCGRCGFRLWRRVAPKAMPPTSGRRISNLTKYKTIMKPPADYG